MNNVEIAKIFEDIADFLELKGENVFKVRAYQRAARAIAYLPKEVEAMLQAGEDLKSIPGVGEAIAKKITELLTTGRLEYYEKLRAEFPPGISTLLTIPGIGPKTAMKLSTELGIQSIDELEQAVRDGRVAQLFRMGDKTAENILKQIQMMRHKDRRIPIGEALPIVDQIVNALKGVPGIRNLTPAGSIRRFKETIGDIDLMGTADDPEAAIGAFVHLPLVKQVIGQGPTKASVIVANGLQVDLRFVEHDSFGSLLQYFTGSKEHNIQLRERAVKQGLKLSEYGITDRATERLEKFASEEAFYRRLGLQYIPPEIREAMGEIERAEQGTIPRLVELSDIKGDLHVHTDWSDGQSTLEEMAGAAIKLGYEYLLVTDHSAGLGVAHGLDRERLDRQLEEIAALNRRFTGFRLLAGIEVDIRADGRIDAPEDVLSKLDIVVAAVHSAMGQSKERMTPRIIDAIANPHVDIIAHPTCRLIGEREPSEVDLEAVFKAALEHGKALEINAMPTRLDLKDIHAYRARELGVKLVISTDAHQAMHLPLMRFGIGVARRAWCEPKHILNTRPLADFLAAFRL
ncbi:MAG: DNA polymerase/3'-5' exonuclease PolX [Dehalococcoidia bacterium]|nr:DNA polymerase/3'-5' exonuclease PolX [Dehalococcoidia bacterium]